MKKLFLLTIIILIGLTGCNPKNDFSYIIPKKVDKFVTGFIAEIHKGNIDTCLTLVSSEMNNYNGRKYLTNTFFDIQNLTINSYSIINATKTRKLGKDGFTNYMIDYEYKVNQKFLYFTIGVNEQDNKLTINAFGIQILDYSLSKTHDFTLKNKSFAHYLFLFLAIFIPIFIIVTLIFLIKTKIKLKWLWIIGIFFGFIKFSINWTTGQFGFVSIGLSLFGAGFTKSGIIAPWILSFSIPLIAIIFWFKRYYINKELKKQKEVTTANQDNQLT